MDYVIIVAGGKGLRMGSEIPKQFLPVAGKPILMRTIERFHEYSPELNIILVLRKASRNTGTSSARSIISASSIRLPMAAIPASSHPRTDWRWFLIQKTVW